MMDLAFKYGFLRCNNSNYNFFDLSDNSLLPLKSEKFRELFTKVTKVFSPKIEVDCREKILHKNGKC
jgi:hypothetical protein